MVCVIDTPVKLAYQPVPKAACSSVKGVLCGLRGERPGGDAVHELFPTTRYRAGDWQGLNGHFRFTVVREPLRRLMSVYSDRVAGRRELSWARGLKRAGALPADPNPEAFFLNLRGYMRAVSVIRHHALPQWLFTGRHLAGYDRVFRAEALDELADTLGARLGRAVEIPRLNRSAGRVGFEELSGRAQAAVLAHLAPEYDFLSGIYPPPAGRLHAVSRRVCGR